MASRSGEDKIAAQNRYTPLPPYFVVRGKIFPRIRWVLNRTETDYFGAITVQLGCI
jgi:hypothetical protein